MSTNPHASPLAVALFEAFARNGGNSPADHFDRNAAEQWMQQALDECMPKPAAAPADLHTHLLHMLGAKDHEDAGRIIGELHAVSMSTPAAPGIDLAPRPMATAPRDGTMLRLLVQFDDHATEDTESPAWTIGACNDDNAHQDERVGWQFAGWCWDHDHFTEGKGTPVGWLPLIDASPKGGIHPDDAAVDAFAAEMKAKLAKAREKGRGGWQGDEPGMQQRLSDMLREHVEKGDPRDVANFCMFLHQRGEGISPKGGSDAQDGEQLALLAHEARELQRKNYGSGMGLHLDMIDWAKKFDALQALIDARPKGGSEALSRAYGYLWHVNHPEDIPTGHPYMSADRAAVEARKELRDMLTHEQRGEGINWVRQKLLADMQATSAEVES